MGKGLLPIAGRLVDRVSLLVRGSVDKFTDSDGPPSRPRTPEEALFLVRDNLGRLIVERRQLQRHIVGLPDTSAGLASKAEVAVRHGREDLARAALSEASRLDSHREELAQVLAGLDADIELLEQAVTHLSSAQPIDPPIRALLAELDRLAAAAAKPGGDE